MLEAMVEQKKIFEEETTKRKGDDSLGGEPPKRKRTDMEIPLVTEARTYAQSASPAVSPSVSGITPMNNDNNMLRTALNNVMNLHRKQLNDKPHQQITKDKPMSKNVIMGSGDIESSIKLTADVNIVAFGLGIDVTEDALKEYLQEEGIKVVKVENLTNEDLIKDERVRSRTMKIIVKIKDHDKVMNPSTWPRRVGVRYYRAPRRDFGDNGGNSKDGRSSLRGQEGSGGRGSIGSGGYGRNDNRDGLRGRDRSGDRRPWNQRNQNS